VGSCRIGHSCAFEGGFSIAYCLAVIENSGDGQS
jgi:hypothetical protein